MITIFLLISSGTIIFFRKQLEGKNATGKYAPLVAIAFPMLASVLGAMTATFTKITGMFLAQGSIYLQAHLGQLLFVCCTWTTLFIISTFQLKKDYKLIPTKLQTHKIGNSILLKNT